ncbi:MAG: DUF3883 domain-containing protein [Saprospirales bacterium]|nr:DUF3883 domain-containing protein [Saprospirales bacterium]
MEWISKSGATVGWFDILSSNEDGSDRYVEVKTTKLGELTPIYVTRKGELEFSRQHEAGYPCTGYSSIGVIRGFL